jgi:hypothetical protein
MVLTALQSVDRSAILPNKQSMFLSVGTRVATGQGELVKQKTT